MIRVALLAAITALTLASVTVTVAAISTATVPTANQIVGRAFGALNLVSPATRALHDALHAIGRDEVPTLRTEWRVRAA